MTIDEKRLALIREVVAAEAELTPGEVRFLLATFDAERGRAEDAERKLAALHAATVERDAANAAFLEHLEPRSTEWHARLARVVEAERVYDETVVLLSPTPRGGA